MSNKRGNIRTQRKQESRKQRPVYIIACEGAVTEVEYFRHIKALFSKKMILDIQIIKKTPKKVHHSSPQQVLSLICAYIEDNPLDEGDEVWLIIDDDNRPQKDFSCIRAWLKKNDKQPFHVGMSKPCFELWLLLHFEDKPKSERDISRRLDSVGCLRQASKKHLCSNKFTEENIKKAIARAKKLHRSSDKLLLANMGSTVYQFMEKLVNAHI